MQSLKGDVLDNGKHGLTIIAGLFALEINAKEWIDKTKVVIPSTKEEGTILALPPLGKPANAKFPFRTGYRQLQKPKQNCDILTSRRLVRK